MSLESAVRASLADFALDLAVWGAGWGLGAWILEKDSVMDRKALAGAFLIGRYLFEILLLQIALNVVSTDNRRIVDYIRRHPQVIVPLVGCGVWGGSIFWAMYRLDADTIVGAPEWQALLIILGVNLLRGVLKAQAARD